MSISAPEWLLQKRFLPGGALIVALGRDASVWSGSARDSDRRVIAEDSNPVSLDVWSAERGLRHIDWLAAHQNGGAMTLLEGAATLLRLRRVDFVQFDQEEAGADIAALYALLQRNGYSMFRFANRNLEFRREPPQDTTPATHLAVAPRHWKRLFTQDRSMFHYAELFPRHGVVPRGVVHVGAHEGEEYEGYVEAGCRRVLFIEADPDTFARLTPRFADNSDVTCVNLAVSDVNGRASFSRMSGSQSSSLLRPKRHLDLYPHITLSETIEVETATLPTILAERGLDSADYNILAMDTQGAERLILAGCGDLLARFDAVATEVNYAELYEGCGLIGDLDDLLFPHGFERVEETSPHHHSWGDAFYVRR
ncbi:FkbM family methyltransferase [Azospirillum sp.]|uniref:FkbM family methyltransferase n=1 Tax=Azospirillum sp. TaxID=34012 RepID=UPI00260AC69C|nr:FkbM family methyltransferase [Azospirillum sp.]